MTQSIGPPPEPDHRDLAQGLMEATVALVPVVGGSAQRLVAVAVKSSIDARMHVWLQAVADCLDEIQGRLDGRTIEDLANDSEFVTSFIRLTQTALGTHLEEKIDLLKAALGQSIVNRSDRLGTAYLHLLDVLEPVDVAVLVTFGRMQRALDRSEIPRGEAEIAVKSQHGLGDFEYDYIFRFLREKRLVGFGPGDNTYGSVSLLPLGERFLDWLELL